MEVNGLLDLEQRIQALEEKKNRQQAELKEKFHQSVDSLKPSNLVKSAWSSITGKGDDDSRDGSEKSGFVSNALGFLTTPQNSFLSSIASFGLGFLSKRINKSVAYDDSNAVISSSARKGIVATLLTIGVGFIANNFFKPKKRNVVAASANSALKTIFTTFALANIDKIAAYITAIVKTDFGKKRPEEV